MAADYTIPESRTADRFFDASRRASCVIEALKKLPRDVDDEVVETICRSLVVSVCAGWESFCEDYVSEMLKHCLDVRWTAPEDLPRPLKKVLGEKKSKDVWAYAGNRWKLAAKAAVAEAVEGFNTPNSSNVTALFGLVDVDNVTQNWPEIKNAVPSNPRRLLDAFVIVRGHIAHGKPIEEQIGPAYVMRVIRLFADLAEAIVDRTMICFCPPEMLELYFPEVAEMRRRHSERR